ncbi:MAG TPA: CPBP family intramembrane glutamic endopeptidase [Anaerolineales bacterium]|nr:CPBP family intramembrane glutamic endopeptidase [Anaerolineales bacterium]
MKTYKAFTPMLNYLMVFLLPILGMALGVGTMFLLNLNETVYGNLIVNLFFLVSVIVLIRLFEFSSENLGLKVIKDQMQRHVVLSLAIFAFYMLFYVFVIRISMLKPFSSSTLWGLLTYLVVVVAEELYFRGVLYSFFEKSLSAKTALIVSSILFGLFHAQQGLRGMVSRMFTGWLWGSVRYSTGMIFLLIIPIHFAYNSVWLLFEGNWNNPPVWAIYILPVTELVIGLVIVIFHNKHSKNNQENI